MQSELQIFLSSNFATLTMCTLALMLKTSWSQVGHDSFRHHLHVQHKIKGVLCQQPLSLLSGKHNSSQKAHSRFPLIGCSWLILPQHGIEDPRLFPILWCKRAGRTGRLMGVGLINPQGWPQHSSVVFFLINIRVIPRVIFENSNTLGRDNTLR